MTSIIPIPAGRSSDQLLASRLLAQVQHAQQDLLRVQSQLSTGRRLLSPSDDAAAALRGIELQRLLERKNQVETNINTSKSYVAATDTALSDLFDQLANLRSTALGAVETIGGEFERQTALEEINRTLDNLLSAANQEFRGRYLFAGTAASTPAFSLEGDFVKYLGNEQSLSTYADLDQLLATSVSGHAVFGGYSQDGLGKVDLNPIITNQTRLSELRGGMGIEKGSFSISDGTYSSVIDISSAETIGDVIHLIEASPPEGRHITARTTANGLQIAIDTAGGGNLTIREVGGSNVAAQLGILNTAGTGTAPVLGGDLDPSLSVTTRLSNVLGVRASAVIAGAGNNNGLVFEATERGADLNGITIQFVDDPGVTKGNETVVYDDSNPGARTLTIHVDAGQSNANDVIAAIENDATASALFSVRLDGKDTTAAIQAGTGLIDVAAAALTTGGSGIEFDQTSGLRVTNGGQTYTLDLSDAVTVGDLLNKFNSLPGGVQAQIVGGALQVRSRLSGGDFSIGENGGATATQLGLRTLDYDTNLAALNYGYGIATAEGVDFTITRADGTSLEIDLSGAVTVGDVIDLINTAPGNSDPATRVVASLAAVGNGIVLTDANASPTGTLTITRSAASEAAYGLGLIAAGAQSATASGSPQVIAGSDVNRQEVKGVFNSLLRLKQAIESDSPGGVQRAVELLDLDLERLGYVRAEVGAKGNSLDVLSDRLAAEKVELQDALSKEVDIDLVEAITNLTTAESALEAALQTIAQTFKMSLLEFL